MKYPNKQVAFLIDPIEKLVLQTDSTILIANEFQSRGYKMFYFSDKNLIYQDHDLYADGYFFEIDYQKKKIIQLNRIKVLLSTFAILFIRQIPPFNERYITVGYLVESLKNTMVINNPRSVRNFTEKLSILYFENIIPKTVICSNIFEIKNFILENKNIIIKPLYNCGGEGVIQLHSHSKNLDIHIQSILKKYGYVMLQEYLSKIETYGDKRVVFVDGKVVGSINRKAKKGDFRVNMVAGGKSFITYLSNKEVKICNQVGVFLKKHDLFLAGIDIIDERLIEINVTSPTGLTAINNFYNCNTEKIIVNKIETKIKNKYNRN